MTSPDTSCSIELLGTLRVVVCGETLTHFPRRKAAWLLTFLALHPGQAHLRERLVDLFWPDLDLPAGRDSLSTTLTALRRLMGCPDVLLTTHQTVSLNWGIVTTDAAEFEQLTSRAEKESLPQRAETLGKALGLYRGEACAGIYEDWALRESERLSGVYADALRGSVAALEALGETEKARRTAIRWVSADPYSEEAHVRLIALHARAGALGDARAAAKKLAHLWQAEFGAALSPAVQTEITALLDAGRQARLPHRQASFPAMLLSPAAQLPVPLDTFFGREIERTWLAEWVIERKSRLVTLIGPGGMGKTRLALHFAAFAAERVTATFVPLSETADPSQILPEIMRALALPPSPDPAKQLAAFFNTVPRPLLILDNLEHLLLQDEDETGSKQVGESARIIQSLLLTTPCLSCLCTSRLALSLRGERLLPLEPLPLPQESAPPRDLETYASVQLYVDRARAVRPDFSLTPENAPAVAAVCRLLDGSPLALELAASWVRLLPPRAMWERLTRKSGISALETRRSDAPARHHSLRAALNWSWRLLKPAEQRLLRQVSVFRGGWTLDAAETVCHEPNALALLSSLLAASLVRAAEDKNGGARYSLLETVRQYAREQLDKAGESEELYRAHAACFQRLIVEAQLTGPDQTYWYSLIDADFDNINAAIDWLEQDPGGAEAGLTLTGRMQPFWQVRGLLKEGRAKLESALVHPNAQRNTSSYAYVLHGIANLAGRQGDLATATARHRESLLLRQALGDELGAASSLMGLGIVAITAGDLDSAQGFYEETLALYRRLDASAGLGDVLNDLGNLAVYRGCLADARPFYEESLAVRRRRDDKQSIANTLSNLGPLHVALGEFDQAEAVLSECLDLCLALGDKRDAVYALKGMADLAAAQERFERAVCLFGAEAALRDALGMPRPQPRERQYQDQLAALQQHLCPTVFRQVWAKGQEFLWEEAVAYARAGDS